MIVKKSKFIEQQKLSRLLSSIGIKMFFSKIPLVGLLSSFVLEALTSQNVNCQINEIVNTFLLAGDKFMP